MKQKGKRFRKATRGRLVAVASAVVVVALALLAIRALPATEDDMRRSACMVDGRAQLCLVTDQDTIVLRSDPIHQQGVWINKHWWWPSCDGRILTVKQGDVPTHHGSWVNPNQLSSQMAELADSIGSLLKRKEIEQSELEYYLRSHGVQDEGYTRIAHYADIQKRETDSLKSAYKRLRSYNSKTKATLMRRYLCNVTWFDEDGERQTTTCQPTMASMGKIGEPMIVHTNLSSKPWGVYAVRNMPWGATERKRIATVTISENDSTSPCRTIIVTGRYTRGNHHDLPNLFAQDGSPVFTNHGRFIGVISKKEVKD